MIWICNVQFVSDESHMRVALIPLKPLLSLMEASCQKNWLSGYKMKNAVNLASAPRAALPTPDTDRLIIFLDESASTRPKACDRSCSVILSDS